MIHVHELNVDATGSAVVNSDYFLMRLLRTAKCIKMSANVCATG